MKRIIRKIVNNVLWGMKAGFKSNLNFEHPFERKNMFNQKRSKSKLSATLLSLILGASVFMGATAASAKEMINNVWGELQEKPRFFGDGLGGLDSATSRNCREIRRHERPGELTGYWSVDDQGI